MSEIMHGLETQTREAEIRRAATSYARHGRPTPPAVPTRHRLAARLRRMADRLDG